MDASLPQELTDKIIDEVAKYPDPSSRWGALKASSLVSRAWVSRSQKYLFPTIKFDNGRFRDWSAMVRPGENGPSSYVTRLHYRVDYYNAYPESLVNHRVYLSYFTNVQTLHLLGVGLNRTEYVSGFMQLRSTIRSLELKNCCMNVNDLVTFLRPFTDLESLSLWNPYVRNDAKLDKRRELPTLKGQLDLCIGPHVGNSFLCELSRLPLALSKITLENKTGVKEGVDRLLSASRKTLAVIILEGKSFVHRSRL